MDVVISLQYPQIVDEICNLDWQSLTSDEMVSAAWAYYYFSIQFRENMLVARSLYPDDESLVRLEREECDTDNLAPWPGVASVGEKMDHDEFMRRALALVPIADERVAHFTAVGEAYLEDTRSREPLARALSIASYEDGGLSKVFNAILRYENWDNAVLRAWQHFLAEHVRFDCDPDEGHGALCRHLPPNDLVLPLWEAFRDILTACVPRLANRSI